MVNNVTDSSGQGNNGALLGVTATSSAVAPGVEGQALYLNGSNSNYVNVPSLMGSPTSITISGWANLKTAGTYGSELISLGNSDVGIRLDATPSDGGGTGAGAYYQYLNLDRGRAITASNYLNGSIDDVRVYNRALSAAEVKQLYNLGH